MDPATLPNARRSVINFGLPALSGQTASSLEVADLERAIRQAILDFEPRILPASLRVRALETGQSRPPQRDRRRDLGTALGAADPARAAGPDRDRSRDRTGGGRRSRADAGRVMDPASPPVLQRRAAAPPRDGRRVRAAVPEDRRAARHERPRGRRPVRRAAARGRRVPGGARAAEDRRRVPALHAVAARDRLSALPGADAVDARRAAPPGQGRPGPRRAAPAPCRAARRCTRSPAPDDATACEFRTAHDVTLLPLEVVSASYFSFAPDLPLNTLPIAQRIKGGLRIRLKTTAGLKFEQTKIDRLCFYLAGP